MCRFCLAKYEVTNENVSIVCFTEVETAGGIHITKIICSLISVVFLILTILVYIVVPKLRDLQVSCYISSKILVHFVTVLGEMYT